MPPSGANSPRLLGRSGTVPFYRTLKSDELAEGQSRMVSVSAPDLDTSEVEFKWNGRLCAGRPIHHAALHGDVHLASRIIDGNPEEVSLRFIYRTFYKGNPQEGSGQAVHLAASRGHMHMMELLLARGASLHSCVTRNGKDHYDVMHAAVFAEARSDNVPMVEYLLEKRAPIDANSDGRWPLHIAFQVGSVDMIQLLRSEMRKQGMDEESQIGEGCPSPLLLGIQMGKMTTEELAKAAARAPLSLHTFISHEPRCIPRFLKQLEMYESEITARHVARHIKGGDLATVLRRSPDAAGALFDAITAAPEVEHQGWHPLPRRVSFASKNPVMFIRHLVNPRRDFLVHYEPDCEWRYDSQTFEAPDWHKDFQDPAHGEPVHDVEVSVVRVPNLLVAEFFAGLTDADSDGELQIFNNGVVSGSIDFVWWNGAWRVDVLQAVLGFWSLSLLILESWIVGGDVQAAALGQDRKVRELKALHSGESFSERLQDFLPDSSGLVGEIATSAAFIGSVGVVCVVHEVMQFLGCVCIGRPCDYLRELGNFWDLFRGLVLMSLFFDTRNSLVRVTVILICWMRLLEMFTSAENIARALLPLKRVSRALVPALVMTLVAFLAFTHVFHYVWGHDHNWEATFFQSFATLITTQLPANPFNHTGLELLVTYGAVLFFSIFMLNIFIGVIGTTYEQEQERVPLTFLQHRACCCQNFLLRARVMPCNLCSRTCANVVSILALGAIVAAQVHGLVLARGGLVTRMTFFLSDLVLLVAAYQTPGLTWRASDKEKRYLWLASPRGGGSAQVRCRCGRELSDADAFCSRCGAPRPSDDEASQDTGGASSDRFGGRRGSTFAAAGGSYTRNTW
mmetsp:Transcript_20841/g.65954  ORF Transcript_20841/g.65954 Transcript_20841/m.65954 type:complete len:850 (+) Transcript_20841:95-2644(+)